MFGQLDVSRAGGSDLYELSKQSQDAPGPSLLGTGVISRISPRKNALPATEFCFVSIVRSHGIIRPDRNKGLQPANRPPRDIYTSSTRTCRPTACAAFRSVPQRDRLVRRIEESVERRAGRTISAFENCFSPVAASTRFSALRRPLRKCLPRAASCRTSIRCCLASSQVTHSGYTGQPMIPPPKNPFAD